MNIEGFLLILLINVVKELMQIGSKNSQWYILFFKKFFFNGVIFWKKRGLYVFKGWRWWVWCIFEIIEIIRSWCIELFLQFKINILNFVKFPLIGWKTNIHKTSLTINALCFDYKLVTNKIILSSFNANSRIKNKRVIIMIN